MDEGTGVHVPVGVDMEVPPSAGDASADEFPVVLEIDGEEGLAGPVFPDAAIDQLPLLRRGQQVDVAASLPTGR